MTPLNRDQIAALRVFWNKQALVYSAVPELAAHAAQHLAALDMATRLLDLCEAEPVGCAVLDGNGVPMKLLWREALTDTVHGDEDVLHPAGAPHRTVALIPRPESKP